MAQEKKDSNKRGIRFYPKHIPKDVRKIIFEKQSEKKLDCDCYYSQERAVYELIRSTKKM